MSAKLPTPASITRRLAAAKCRRARVAAGLSQEQAAQLAGVAVRTLRDIELGRVRMVALELLLVLEAQPANDTKRAA